MTENKRFILFDDKETIIDKKYNETYWTFECIQLEKLVDVLNELAEENEQLIQENKKLKKQLGREETDKKRLMSYLMRYKGFSFDEIVDDYFNEPYYDNWWEDGFYEFCWDEYLKEKNFNGCDEE